MKTSDVLILGGGAAGLMCAASSAARGRRTVVVDHGPKIGRKILVSGGGRCNFTNLGAQPSHYVSANPAFVKNALARFTPKRFIALVEERGIAYHEKKDGQLFCNGNAAAIVSLLVDRARGAGAEVLTGVLTTEVRKTKDGFALLAEGGKSFQARKLVVATGGLSWPQIGATDLGMRLARQFGLKVVEPKPALVGLTFPPAEMERFKDLAGIHMRVNVACGPFRTADDVMITHKGLSGPAVLNASLFWEPGMEVTVNWVPGGSVEETYRKLLREKKAGKGVLRETLRGKVTRRLADRLAYHAGARGAWTTLSDEMLWEVAKAFHATSFVPSGTFGYGQAEVMRGGVDTHALSPDTMECLNVPGLYFIGEVMDVTGRLGGFNFQWAWASGVAAGTAV